MQILLLVGRGFLRQASATIGSERIEPWFRPQPYRQQSREQQQERVFATGFMVIKFLRLPLERVNLKLALWSSLAGLGRFSH